MSEWRNRGGIGPMRWHLLAGVAACAVSVATPWLAASRAARVEARSGDLTTCLAEVLQASARHGEPDCEHVFARTCALATARQVFANDLSPLPCDIAGSLLLANKHYLFRANPVVADPSQSHPADAVPAHEVLAWPIDAQSAGHAMFFAAEDAPRAYTRNLSHGHQGAGSRMPMPGHGRRRTGHQLDLSHTYRSVGDDRWICF
jgi:hypothetical protein